MPSGSKAPRKEPWWSRESAPLPAAAAVASDGKPFGLGRNPKISNCTRSVYRVNGRRYGEFTT